MDMWAKRRDQARSFFFHLSFTNVYKKFRFIRNECKRRVSDFRKQGYGHVGQTALVVVDSFRTWYFFFTFIFLLTYMFFYRLIRNECERWELQCGKQELRACRPNDDQCRLAHGMFFYTFIFLLTNIYNFLQVHLQRMRTLGVTTQEAGNTGMQAMAHGMFFFFLHLSFYFLTYIQIDYK